MKTIEIKVYKFDELDKQTKEKVIDTIKANDYDFTTEGKIY